LRQAGSEIGAPTEKRQRRPPEGRQAALVPRESQGSIMPISTLTLRTAALGLLASSLAAVAPAAPPPAVVRVEKGLVSADGTAASIEARMAHYNVPAISIALIDGNHIRWARAWGKLSRTGSSPATPGTLFQAGSLSKPFTAAAALSLVRDGRLALYAPVNDRLRSWKLPDPGNGEARLVTLRRILSHNAAINVGGFRGYEAGAPLPSLRQVLDGEAPANSPPIRVEGRPGSGFHYSGGGYVIVQQLLEDATGKPFAKTLHDLILAPLGMRSSSFAQPLPERAAAKAAVGHRPDGSEAEGRWHVFPEAAAAGLWTTPTDLARFVLWIMRGAGPGAPAAQRAVAARMLEPQLDLPSGSKAGLGLVLEGSGRAFRFSHSGSTWGYRAIMLGYPATGQGAVIMANSDTSPELVKELLASLAAEYGWPEPARPTPPAAPRAASR
jgi:CubicO group peptidase (beta-lactamase class C family)